MSSIDGLLRRMGIKSEAKLPSGKPISYSRYNFVFVLAALTLIVGDVVGISALRAVERLPPPPITATACIDEKLKFLRDHPSPDAKLLAVGSSVTWRNLNFRALDPSTLERWQPLNAAPCYLDIAETGQFARFLIEKRPHVEAVLMVTGMRDFQSCQNAEFFSPTQLSLYLDRSIPPELVYLQNFRPRSFFRDVTRIERMRSGEDVENPLAMDRFGSGPLLISEPDPRSDVQVDGKCFDELAKLARWLNDRDVRFIVVTMPDMPEWQQAYDPFNARSLSWHRQLEEVARTTPIRLIEGRDFPGPQRFTDPAHFHWSSTGAFTRWIAQEAALAKAQHAS